MKVHQEHIEDAVKRLRGLLEERTGKGFRPKDVDQVKYALRSIEQCLGDDKESKEIASRLSTGCTDQYGHGRNGEKMWTLNLQKDDLVMVYCAGQLIIEPSSSNVAILRGNRVKP